MRLSENRVIAWIVLIICVAGSFYFAAGSLASERAEILEVFHEGAEDRDAGHCMSAYVQRAFENARIMAKEVQLHLDANHDRATEMLELIADYDPASDNSFDSGNRIKMVTQMADDLYNDMYASSLSDAERSAFELAYDDYQGARRFMQKDPYLEMAQEFNNSREASFLSELASKLRGIDRLCETFY